MSMGNVAETALLNHYFVNLAVANIGDASGLQPAGAAGNLYVALHTGDPGEAGNQQTNEAAYTSYARVAVVRSAGGWTVSGDTVNNTALVQFPQCTGGSETLTHFSIGTASSGAGSILLYGALTSSLAVSNGIQPQFAASALSASVN